jgi:GxxExxY protein
MPIHCPIEFVPSTDEEFDVLDRRVLHHCFASQNALGRFCDEGVYEADLKLRLEAGGFSSVQTQVPVTVSYKDFTKRYSLDLVVDNAALYDLKVVSSFLSEHEMQMLNYVLLTGLRRGKLVNFRTTKVEGRLVATRLTPALRRRFPTDTSRWEALTPSCEALHGTMVDLLQDWGAFLEVSLYQDGLTHFLGGAERVLVRAPMTRDGQPIGFQRMRMHAADVGFRVTAFTDRLPSHEAHLRRLVPHAGLRGLQWINLNHANITFITIK